MYSTEWEVILDYKDYEPWMRFSEGRVSLKPYMKSIKILIESQRKDQYRPKGAFIRVTDMPQVPYDICKHISPESVFTYFDRDENVNEERLFFEESWSKGKEIRKIMISSRYYQVSPTETQF